MGTYEVEKQLLEEMLNGRTSSTRHLLQQATPHQLNRLTDTLDKLAALVDEEASAEWRNADEDGANESQ